MPSFRIWSHFPPFRRSAIPSFRVWGHFPPFRDSAIPPFRYSAVPSFRLLGSPHKAPLIHLMGFSPPQTKENLKITS